MAESQVENLMPKEQVDGMMATGGISSSHRAKKSFQQAPAGPPSGVILLKTLRRRRLLLTIFRWKYQKVLLSSTPPLQR